MILSKIQKVGLIGLFAISMGMAFGDSFKQMINSLAFKNGILIKETVPSLNELKLYKSTFYAYCPGCYVWDSNRAPSEFLEKVWYLNTYIDLLDIGNPNNDVVYLLYLERFNFLKETVKSFGKNLVLDWEYLRQMIIREKHLTPEAIATAEEDFAYFQEYGCYPGEEY